MEIDLKKLVTGPKKEAFKDQDGKDLNVKSGILLAMVSYREQNLSPEDCLKQQKIFDKVDEAEDKVDLKSDELVRLKNILSKSVLSPLMAGKIINLIEPEVQS